MRKIIEVTIVTTCALILVFFFISAVLGLIATLTLKIESELDILNTSSFFVALIVVEWVFYKNRMVLAFIGTPALLVCFILLRVSISAL